MENLDTIPRNSEFELQQLDIVQNKIDNTPSSIVKVAGQIASRVIGSAASHFILIILCIIQVLWSIFLDIYSFIYKGISFSIAIYCIYDALTIFCNYKKLEITKWRSVFDILDGIISIIIGSIGFYDPLLFPVGCIKLLNYVLNFSRILRLLRLQVGLNKRFYEDGEFCLDLVFITDRIIAMGLPAVDIEATYRNPLDEVSLFFSVKYPFHHLVVNLCNERANYSSTYFHSILTCPFPDHQVPTLSSMFILCYILFEYLKFDKENVVAVHCKGGKGRTGLVVTAWLLYSKFSSNVKEALSYYATRRTDSLLPGAPKTIRNPSQLRFLDYFNILLSYKDVKFKQKDSNNLIKESNVCFKKDIIDGFVSGYTWSIKKFQISRINKQNERYEWSFSDLKLCDEIGLPYCLFDDLLIKPIHLEILKNGISNVYEWKIYLHSDCNIKNYLIKNVSSTKPWSISKSKYLQLLSQNKDFVVYQYYDENVNQFSIIDKDPLDMLNKLVKSLDFQPFQGDLLKSSKDRNIEDFEGWISNEFVIKIYPLSEESSVYEDPAETGTLHSEDICFDKDTLRKSSNCLRLNEFVRSSSDSFGSCITSDLSINQENTNEEDYLLKEINFDSVDSNKKNKILDSLQYPLRNIKKWSLSLFSSSIPFAHIWFHPSLVHISTDSRYWYFIVEWDNEDNCWIVKECFLTVLLKAPLNIDLRQPGFEDISVNITFQYK
ncbi:dual specificity phosphatase, catalytic domain-containing protein [Cryptosporidium muris RN66]|uniref:Dual specificity phosphatase, catalytic domain-containing protein n=1 Tax=Cryptosporidium muris (strain RN66) TaxID=441375 RepID=B6AGF6_CRYMR|nr:dual specificity phosphatase, catalytic domain-containing protein [Cryptosporidium muris RN66]EEA07297.1 dual specificity phosphatase, catalytic domain-containing protein [Cryptosporidium muris RN66]|eukprot:XP_002141646.1 dual specificity phosphatase, catalytic domain-containing protein [Cryptosporidium muris RN66]